jgi:hypothetical protein
VKKEEEEIMKMMPRNNLPRKLEKKLQREIKQLNFAYVRNLETLEKMREGEFRQNLKFKVSKRVLNYLNEKEKTEVLERERLIIKEMDGEIHRLVKLISKCYP